VSYIISDIDGTLTQRDGSDEPNTALIERLNEAVMAGDAQIIIVSARNVDRLQETRAWLQEHGVAGIDEVHLSDFPEGPNAGNAYKAYKAAKLLEEGKEIDLAIDNDEGARAAYQELGIRAITPEQAVADGLGIESAPEDQADEPAPEPEPAEAEPPAGDQRAIVDVPAYVSAAAAKGLEYESEGKAGDGLQPATVREAQQMADGKADTEKVAKIAPWIARHRGDWEGNPQNSDPSSEGFPGPGAVAAYLWGVDPTSADGADKVAEWATRITEGDEAPAERATAQPKRKAKNMSMEYRATTGAMAASDDGYTYTGYIALFDEPSSPALGFTEIIKRGAFAKSVSAAQRGEWEVKAYQDHNPSLFLGTTKTGTLTLQEDERGLKAQVQLNPEVTYAADLAANLKRDGASFGASFGFTVPAKGDKWSDDGGTRELLNCRLVECSILTGMQPAYPSTVGLGAVRGLAERMDTEPGALRDAIDSLMNGTTDVDNLRLLRAIIEKAHGAITEPEPEPEPGESQAKEPVEIPASIRELQLRLMMAKR
jgi:HK97 family phage prohead protease